MNQKYCAKFQFWRDQTRVEILNTRLVSLNKHPRQVYE